MKHSVNRILQIDASARKNGSYSRKLTNKLVGRLKEIYPHATHHERDVYQDVRFLNEAMVENMATSKNGTSDQGHLSVSDELVRELLRADVLVLGVPVYNFSIPAALKAWIDLIVRAGQTFRFGPGGAQGLVKNLKVYVVVCSNGTTLQGPDDFASKYLQFIFGFIGVSDIQFIDATQLLIKGADRVMVDAEENIRRYISAHGVPFN